MPREFEIRTEIALDATPEQVWEAITTEAGLEAWFMRMEIPPDGAGAVAWDPPTHFATRTPAAEDGSTHAFEYLIEARDGASTVLRFVHSGFLGEDWSAEYEGMTRRGWDMYLHTLAQYLTYFPGRPATYVEAEGPPESAGASGWPVLLRALGVRGPAAPGDQLRLIPDGPAPLDAVVDYVGPEFLGLRTADGLIRFHGRSALGMTVAVAQHHYAPDVDRAEAQRSWQSWLNQVFA